MAWAVSASGSSTSQEDRPTAGNQNAPYAAKIGGERPIQ